MTVIAPLPPCEFERCGELRGKGRPPRGWYAVRRSGFNLVGVHDDSGWCWYCSIPCMVRSLGVTVVDPAEPPQGRLDDLNRLAGTSLTIMDATPHRVQSALARAFERVIHEVAVQKRRDARGRPTQAVLLAEAVGERIDTSICSQCNWEKPVAEFSPASGDGHRLGNMSSWCKTCTNAYYAVKVARRHEGEVTQDGLADAG